MVIHIGSGKTGTSSIQRFLDVNRSGLAEHGVLYPLSPGRRRHVRLGLSLKSDEALATTVSWERQQSSSPAEFRRDVRRQLQEEVAESGLPRLLLSDEALFAAPRGELERLRGLVDEIGRSTRLVVYLRRQDDHLCSRYQQVVKTGEVRTLAERVETMDLTSTYDYHSRLAAWRSALAPSEVVVRRFEPPHFDGGSIFQDFLDAVGLEAQADRMRPVPRANESLDAESVEFLRLYNIHRVEQEGATRGVINNRKWVQVLEQASTGPTLTLPARTLDAWMEQWVESNRSVAREFLDDRDGVLFRAPRKSRNTTVEQRLDPGRVGHFLTLLQIPESAHQSLHRIAEREARRSS